MTTTNELMVRIQGYDCVERFCILNKSGTKLNTEKEDDKKGANQINFFPDIPKLVNKANSVVRDIDPIVNKSLKLFLYYNFNLFSIHYF